MLAFYTFLLSTPNFQLYFTSTQFKGSLYKHWGAVLAEMEHICKFVFIREWVSPLYLHSATTVAQSRQISRACLLHFYLFLFSPILFYLFTFKNKWQCESGRKNKVCDKEEIRTEEKKMKNQCLLVLANKLQNLHF